MNPPLKLSGKLCDTCDAVTVEVAGGRVVAVRTGAEPDCIGGDDVWIAAGFIDLQINGYGGYDFNGPAGLSEGAWGSAGEVSDAVGPIFELAARAGTPLLCPTITTDSAPAMTARLAALARALEADAALAAAVAGIHVEGPYISAEDGPRGAHPLQHVRDPEWDEFRRWQEAAGGRIRLLTLAPERAGALRFVERISENGVVAAIGHTAAEPKTIRDAVRAGARVATHLGNGAHARIARHPNYIWEQLAHDGLFATVIADGHHLPPEVLKCFARVKGPDRIALVSDAVALGGLRPGVYGGGRFEVQPSGRVVLAGTPYLAGAGHLLDTCMANTLRYTDLSLAQAVGCAATVPARILSLEARKGRVQAGCDADLTLFRLPEFDGGPLRIAATVRAGEVVYRG